MTTGQTATGTERLRFQHGARLTAADLRDAAAHESRMRGLHVRAMHNTWGIALGFTVYQAADSNLLLVGPGLAYDCQGREIVSAHSLVIDPPPLPRDDANGWWFDLVMRFNDLTTTDACSGIPIGCPDGRIGSPAERPAWRWELAGALEANAQSAPLPDAVRLGDEIPIARIAIDRERHITALDLSTRRYAQRLTRPHIASGVAPQGSQPILGTVFLWTVQVDTSAAGFSQTPHYFASLADHPLGPTSGFLTNQPSQSLDALALFQGPFLSISNATAERFTLLVTIAMRSDAGPDVVGRLPLSRAAVARGRMALPVAVNWVGIEPVEGCQPLVVVSALRRLSGTAVANPDVIFRNLAMVGAPGVEFE